MIESHILTTDGKEYIDVDSVREALGTVDENVYILGVIRQLKQERDELKDKVSRMKKRENAAYGASCGYSEYSEDKAPAFVCSVSSYSWSFDAGSPFRNDSICVELELTPTANYKGTFDMEDLKRYIQEYGRDKKLGVLERADYENAKAARVHLAELYKQIKGVAKLDTDLSQKDIYKAILDEYTKVRNSWFSAREELKRAHKGVVGLSLCDYNGSETNETMANEILDVVDTMRKAYKRLDEEVAKLRRFRADIRKALCLSQYTDEDGVQEARRIYDLFTDLVYFKGSVARAAGLESNADTTDILETVERMQKLLDAKEKRCGEMTATLDRLKEIIGAETLDNEEFVKGVEEQQRELRELRQKLLQYRYSRAEDPLSELRAKIREIYRSIFNCSWEEGYSYCSALDNISNEYERVTYFYKEKNNELKEAKEKYSRYCLAVGSLFDVPAEHHEDISWIEDAFKQTKDDYMKRGEELKAAQKFRMDIWGALEHEGRPRPPRYNATILDAINTRLQALDRLEKFRGDVAEIVGMNPNETCRLLLTAVKSIKDSRDAALDEANKTIYAVDKDEYEKQKNLVDRLARLRSDICTEFALGHEGSDEELIKRVRMYRDCHHKLCKDYTELRKAIWDAMDRKPETLPEETERLVGEVRLLAYGEKCLHEFRDAIAEAIGITYPTTNNFIVKRVTDIYKMYGEAQDEAMRITKLYNDVAAKYSATESKYREQFSLRQQWYTRYESEHERANGVQKKLDKLRGIEAERDKYKENCKYWHDMYDSVEAARGALTTKIRELQKELKEERHPNLEEFREEHPIDTDPGYLRKGEEDTDGSNEDS